MDFSWITNDPILVGSLAFVVGLSVLAFIRLKRGQAKAFEQLRQQNRSLDKELQKANKQLLEVRSVVVGLGQRASEQQDIIKHGQLQGIL